MSPRAPRTTKMHAHEVDTDAALVRRLLAAQFPACARLPIEPVRSSGTDNAIYRLGGDMAVRLPRIGSATRPLAKERRWLPRLAPFLPLAVPVPLAKGMPAEGYPWEWSVYSWLEGETASAERIGDPGQAAADLARFLVALRERGRGWALSWALIALPYYLDTNPAIVRDARRTIVEVLAERAAPA